MTQVTFRTEILPGDEKRIREITTSTGFFYDIEIDVAVELAEEKLREGEKSSYQFIFAERDGLVVAYSCFGLIPGSELSYDLYWIATHNDLRGQGIGKIVLEETHRQIAERGGRNVIAETSTLIKYRPTRHFYEQMGYHEAGRIHNFYKEGDGKVTFVKTLTPYT
ncbi:MAG: GNAT family N-acetyltransferase [Bacteroidales bacterium]|nr:GNAT family N-acetyltransferase [Bacteroidales bacterium]